MEPNTNNSDIVNSGYEWSLVILYTLLFCLSISGNCMVIATIHCNKSMRTVTNIYLINLAVSDLLLGVFNLPLAYVGQIFMKLLSGTAICKMVPYLQAVFVSVKAWTVVAMYLERYTAINRLLTSRLWQTKKSREYGIIAAVWCAALLINTPMVFVYEPKRNENFNCRQDWTNKYLEKIFRHWLTAACILIPFILSIYYFLIVSKLCRRMKQKIQLSECQMQRRLTRRANCCVNTASFAPEVSCNTNRNHLIESFYQVHEEHSMGSEMAHSYWYTHMENSIKEKIEVIRMLWVIIIIFLICCTPIDMLQNVYLYHHKLYQYIGVKAIAALRLLSYISSACNPVVYFVMNRKIRLAVLSLIKNCKLFEFPTEPELRNRYENVILEDLFN